MSSLKSTQQSPPKPSVGGDKKADPDKIKFAPKRKGTDGRQVDLLTNFFKIDLIEKPPNFFHYNIEIVFESVCSTPPKSASANGSGTSSGVAQATSTTSVESTAPKAPAVQSGKPKGKGRKAAAAKRAGVSVSNPVTSPVSTESPTTSTSSPVASTSSPVASTSSPVASTSSPVASTSSPAANADDPVAGVSNVAPQESSKPSKTPRSKRAPKGLHNAIFREVFRTKPEFKCNILPAFDGEKNFYSKTKFSLTNNRWSGTVQVQNGERHEQYLVNITVPDTSHDKNLGQLLKKGDPQMLSQLQALDILLRNGPRLNKIALGPNLFCKFDDQLGRELRSEIGEGRFCDPLKYIQFGFYQSARRVEAGLYCNVDRAMAIFTKGGALIELIDSIVRGASKKTEPLTQQELFKISEQIKNVKFGAKHLNFRTFTATGLTQQTVEKQTFPDKETNTQITVYEYFSKTYPEFVKKYPLNKFLPCVKYNPRAPKYIPIECVHLLPNEVYRAKLKAIQQGQVTRISSQQKPFERFDRIKKQISTILSDNKLPGLSTKEPTSPSPPSPIDYLKEFGVKQVSTKPATVKARILDAPKLLYRKYDQQVEEVTPKNGQWDFSLQFYKPSSEPIGENWAVVNVSEVGGKENMSSISQERVREMIKVFISEAQFKGMRCLKCPKKTMFNFNYRGKGTLKDDLFAKLGSGIRFVVFLIPKHEDIYSEFKSLAELQNFGHGLATQCMLQEQKCWKQEGKLFLQYLRNILLKVNPKLGGTNQSIRSETRPAIMKDKSTMFMGLDVTHPSPVGDSLKRSIAAVVATYTDDFDKVFAKTRIQEADRKELIDVKEIMKQLLESYKGVNKCYPQKIVVYRDGVGEGDFEKMVKLELGGMRKACEELKQKVKFTYIMVQKRHNMRAIPAATRATDSFQNISPGTCVDDIITHSELFEFYLCSHAGMLGTSRPAKYVVLVDDNMLSANEIQKTTYWLAHLWPRCTKTASIPPTVWLAHLLAERTRKYLAFYENSDGRSSVGSGSKAEVLSEAQRLKLDKDITIHSKLNGILHFI